MEREWHSDTIRHLIFRAVGLLLRIHSFERDSLMIHMLLVAVLFAPPDAEPPRILTLTVNGKEYTVEEGREFRIDDELKRPRLKVISTGERAFKYGGMTFRYPAELDFETDHEDGTKNWEIANLDSELNVYVLPAFVKAEFFLRQYVASMVEFSEVKDQKPRLKTGRQKIGGNELKTYECSVAFDAEDTFQFWVLELPPLKGRARLLFFDLEYEDGKLTTDTVRLRNTVLKSLKF